MAPSEDFEMPIAKRQKLEQNTTQTRRSDSRLFAPFRTIGLVSPTNVPFTSVPLGKTTFQITTSVGRSLQTYDLRRGLNLVFLSRPQCPENITATCAYRDRVFAAWGDERPDTSRGIWVLKRGRLIGQLETEDTFHQRVEKILVFGVWIVGCGPKAIEIWRNDTYEHYTTILQTTKSTPADGSPFSGNVCTMPTFLNKIFVGCRDGSVAIFNVTTGKLVFTLQPSSTASGPVTALAPAPAVGLLAVAYENGSVTIVNVETDETVIELRTSNSGHPASCITFRSDGIGAGEDGRQDGIMATSCVRTGDITLWDLNRGGKVVGVLRGAHEISSSTQASGINKVEFLPGQPLIISSGLDNSIRSWIFDQTPFSPIPRPLHSRSGHAAPVSLVHFLPAASDGSEASGKWLLSAGHDRSLWGFSLRKDGQSSELSQGNIKHKAKKAGNLVHENGVEDFKAPPIIAIACSLNRDGGMGAVGGSVWTNTKASNAEEAGMTGWESVLTAHEQDRYARTWFWGRKKAGRWAFETGDKKPVTSVAITTCGTFALVGSAGGSLDMHNLQSGIHRQRFPPRLKPGQAKQLKARKDAFEEIDVVQRGHDNSITGIVTDSLNRTVISTDLNGTVIFWDFASGHIAHRVELGSGSPTAIRYNSVSGLVSMACDDLCIRVIDVETKRIVRELWGCVGQIYDHCFSHDGRWIVACSMDSVVRVFDLATGHLMDAFRTATCTNVAFSSTGEFLATAHAGSIGINIWNNKSLFMHIPSRQIDEESGIIDLTQVSEFEATSQLAIEGADDEDELSDQQDKQSSIDQLDKALLTLSLTPSSKWQTLLNLDTIRQRNKPVEPPQKPKAAPFFLNSTLTNGNSTSSADHTLLDQHQQETEVITDVEKSHISRLSSLAPASTTMSTLISDYSSQANPDPSDVVAHLSILSPSATDLEIRSLTLNEMEPFIHAMISRLKQRRDFELVNTWMSVFLRVHAEFVTEVDDIRKAVLLFKHAMDEEAKRLSAMVGWGRGVVDFLRSAR